MKGAGTLVDGGIYEKISIGDPIERCREDGYADTDIIIDSILCYKTTSEIKQWSIGEKMRWKNASNFYSRRREISDSAFNKQDYDRLKRGY